MFRDAFRIVIEIVCEVEPAIGWQLVKGVDLAFARLQRRADVVFRVIIDLHAARLQPRYGKIVKLSVAQLARVFAVQPMQFIGIKRGMTPPNMIEIEKANDLFEVDLLPVIFWGPTEQTQIIANGRRQIASLNV